MSCSFVQHEVHYQIKSHFRSSEHVKLEIQIFQSIHENKWIKLIVAAALILMLESFRNISTVEFHISPALIYLTDAAMASNEKVLMKKILCEAKMSVF